MRILLSLLLGGVLVAAPLGAPAQQAPPAADPQAAEARQRYTAGMAHFQLEEWDQAITEWETGFRAKPVPQFLYNIAQAYRLSKRYEQAIKFYKKYLVMEPKAPNRGEVDRHITNLTAVLEQDRKAQVAPPTAPMTVKPKNDPNAVPTAVTPEPVASPAPMVAQPSPAPVTEPIVKKEDKPVPITKKAWFWGVIGGAAAVVVGAIIIGAVVGTSGGDDTKVLPLARF